MTIPGGTLSFFYKRTQPHTHITGSPTSPPLHHHHAELVAELVEEEKKTGNPFFSDQYFSGIGTFHENYTNFCARGCGEVRPPLMTVGGGLMEPPSHN